MSKMTKINWSTVLKIIVAVASVILDNRKVIRSAELFLLPVVREQAKKQLG